MHNYEEEMNTRENDSYRGNRIYDAGMLSDMDIREFWKKGIEIEVADYQNYSFDFDKQLQHGSVDLRFRHDYKKISVPKGEVLTFEKMKNHNYTISDEVKGNNKIILEPGEMILTTTIETVRLRRVLKQKKIIIALNLDFEKEAMLIPYVDKAFENIRECIEYLKQLGTVAASQKIL